MLCYALSKLYSASAFKSMQKKINFMHNRGEAMTEFHQTEIDKIFDVANIITLFRMELPPQEHCNEETYDFWEMLYMEEGVRTIKIGNAHHCLQTGQLLFYPPHIPHQFVDNLDQSCKIGLLSFQCQSEAMSYFKHKIFVLKANEKSLMIKILQQGSSIFKWFESDCVQRGMYAKKDTAPAQLYKLRLNFETFLACLYTDYQPAVRIPEYKTAKKRNQNKEDLDVVKEYLTQNLNRSLAVEQISKECRLSVSTLKRILKEEAGCGVIDYFNDLKIQKAMEFIRNSSMNFTEMSEELGFSSPFYFSRIFKKKLGVSPMEYSKSFDR